MPCPRCGRPHGRPIVYGPPRRRTQRMAERGLVVLGGRRAGAGSPRVRCASCGTAWSGGELPAWWPPRVAAAAGGADRVAAGTMLRERVDRLAVVVDAARTGRGREALAALLRECDAGTADDLATGHVVPSDRVLLAEVLEAGVRVCRAVEAEPETLVGDEGLRTVTVPVSIREFDDAAAAWAGRGAVDFAAMPDDPGILAVLAERARLEALVGSGAGSASPDPGPGWDDELSDAASRVVGPSATGWVRHAWSHLGPPVADPARARLRVHALGRVRGVVLDLLDGGSHRERGIVHDPGMPRERIRVLAEADGVAIGPADASIDPGALLDGPPLERLVRIEGERIGPVLLRALGPSELIASVWASAVAGARYPVAAAVVGEVLRGSSGVLAVREWFHDGMPLR